MALIGNRSVLLKSPGRYFGGSTVSDNRSNFGTQGSTRCRYVGGFPAINATPSGYRPPYSWIIAIKNGEMSSTNAANTAVSATGTAVGGITTTAPASITFTVADATGQLISSGTGTAAMTFTVDNLLLTASLNGLGSAAFTLNTNTPLLGALASGEGSSLISFSGSLTPYAIGNMVGTTDVATSVVNANIVSVNGYSVTGNGQAGTEWGPA